MLGKRVVCVFSIAINVVFAETIVYDDANNVTTKVNKTLEINTFSFTFWMKPTPPPFLKRLCMPYTIPTKLPPTTNLLKMTTTTEEYSRHEYYSTTPTEYTSTRTTKSPKPKIHFGNKAKFETSNKYTNTLTKFDKIPFTYKLDPKPDNDAKKSGFNAQAADVIDPAKLGHDKNRYVNIPQRFKPPMLTTTTEESYPIDDDYTLSEIEANCGEGLVFFDGGCFPDVS